MIASDEDDRERALARPPGQPSLSGDPEDAADPLEALDAADPADDAEDLQPVPDHLIGVEAVFNEGARWRRVGAQEVSKPAFASLCHLVCEFPGGTAYGTGAFVSGDTVITAAHNVLSREGGVWARKVVVVGGRVARGRSLFGESTTTLFETYRAWIDRRSTAHDIAAIKIEKPTFRGPVRSLRFATARDGFLAKKPVVSVSGYPDRGRDHGTLWTDRARLSRADATYLYYRSDTLPGKSGAPAIVMSKGKPVAIGVHGYAVSSANRALRLTDPIVRQIRRWRDKRFD